MSKPCWSYRVRRVRCKGEAWYEMVEAHYVSRAAADRNEHYATSAEGTVPGSETIEGLRWTLEQMLEAFAKPVIDNRDRKADQ